MDNNAHIRKVDQPEGLKESLPLHYPCQEIPWCSVTKGCISKASAAEVKEGGCEDCNHRGPLHRLVFWWRGLQSVLNVKNSRFGKPLGLVDCSETEIDSVQIIKPRLTCISRRTSEYGYAKAISPSASKAFHNFFSNLATGTPAIPPAILPFSGVYKKLRESSQNS